MFRTRHHFRIVYFHPVSGSRLHEYPHIQGIVHLDHSIMAVFLEVHPLPENLIDVIFLSSHSKGLLSPVVLFSGFQCLYCSFGFVNFDIREQFV